MVNYRPNQTLIEESLETIYRDHSSLTIQKCPKKITPHELLSTIQTYDMFSTESGYLLQQPTWLSKPSKEAESTFKSCIDIIQNFNLSLIIIVNKLDKRSSIYKHLKKNQAIEKECPDFKDWELQKVAQWVSQYCKNQSISINKASQQLLIEAYGTTIGIIKQELNKCITTIHPKTTIEPSDIIVSSGISTSHYASLSDQFKKGNIQQIIQLIMALLNTKEDPHKIINHILFQLNMLYPILLGMNQSMTNETLAKSLSKHPYYIKTIMADLNQNPMRHIIPTLYGKLAKIDCIIKSGKLTAKQALLQFCNELLINKPHPN